MAVGASQSLISLKAGADMSAAAAQYTFVKVSDENTIINATAATDLIIGVLQNRPKSGEAASVCIAGRTKLRASAGINDGVAVTATTGGKAVTTTTAGHFVAGITLTTVANDGEVVDALVVQTRVPA